MKKSQKEIALETLKAAAESLEAEFSTENFKDLIDIEATAHQSKQANMELFIKKLVENN